MVNDINIFSLEKNLITIFLKDITIVCKDNKVYKNMYALCRLLSLEELIRIDYINPNNPIVHDSLEMSITDKVLIEIIGLNKDDINFEKCDAGFISRIANGAILKSLEYIKDPLASSSILEDGILNIEIMSAIIAKYLNISYIEVTKMPINKIIRLFAICRKTFPKEISLENDVGG